MQQISNCDTMTYTHGEYTLYTRMVTLKGGREQQIFFFAKRTPKSGNPTDIPPGKEVGINKRTGLPYLKNK